MIDRLAAKDTHNDLSPQLRPVLSSLNVNLEAELNRYRRNRLKKDASSDDVFADLNDPVFDVNVVDIEVPPSAISLPPPPPVPPNRRLNALQNDDSHAKLETRQLETRQPISGIQARSPQPLPSHYQDNQNDSGERSDTLIPGVIAAGSIVNVTAVPANSAAETPAFNNAPNNAPNSYLESSEKLIESIDDLPPMPEPVDIKPKPRRKTVSLLAGAVLGLLGLVAGLGVSYVVSSPAIMQRLADLFNRQEEAVIAETENTFDPPGPDLSEREFVDLELDNLSSLEMSADPLDPANNPSAQALPGLPPADRLPPIEGQPTQQPTPDGIQAAVVPAGVTYYVTVPFTSDLDLTRVRQSVDEAFVRSFSDGNRIQIAAFDNPTDAQAFVENIQSQGITAFVYGPTTE